MVSVFDINQPSLPTPFYSVLVWGVCFFFCFFFLFCCVCVFVCFLFVCVFVCVGFVFVFCCLFCCFFLGGFGGSVEFAVFVYVSVMYIKMPQCNFADEIVK